MSVTNDEILLAFALSKIVIDSLAKKHEESIDNSKPDVELKEICLMNLELLKDYNCITQIQEYIKKIKEILEKIDMNQ